MIIALLILIIAVAYRGKGGGFVTWGILPKGANNKAHALGAFLVGSTLALITVNPFYMPLFAGLWFLYTKPSTAWLLDFCGGFTWLRLVKATARESLILPICLLTFYLGTGSIWYLLGILLLSFLYWLGGKVNRHYANVDPVEFAEWLTGLSGIILAGVYGMV
jgi:hypothetical protein